MRDLNISQTLKYINDLPKDGRTDCQCLQKLFVNIIESTVEQFFTRFDKFREQEKTAKFIKFSDSIKLDELNLQMFSWMDRDDFEMQLIEFQSSSILKQKFVELRVNLENIEMKQLDMRVSERNVENKVLRTWNSIPENFVCFKTLQQHYYPCFHLHMLVNFCS